MNRSIILAALIISGAILLNGYLNRVSTHPREHPAAIKRSPTKIDKGIAVLPFENLSRDPDNVSTVDQVQEDIIVELSKMGDLKVISRTSLMQYKGETRHDIGKIGKELGVAHVLQGSVQRAGDNIRVNVQLIDAATDRHLWADTYDRRFEDLPAVESEIAKQIAEIIRAGKT